MKVVILDDDSNRHSKLFNFWLQVANKAGEEQFDCHWLKTADNFLDVIIANKDVTHISLDHDLGTTQDVSRIMNKWVYDRPEDFDKAFKDKIVVIHSMNPVGAQRIASHLYGICQSVDIIPICQMS